MGNIRQRKTILKCSGSQSVRIKKFKLFQFHDATQNGLMWISRKGPWILALLAVPSPTTPLGDAALHSKLSLRLGMVTHAKRSVYIIHFKCIASLSHLDFGTSPSIQLCPDLTTCRTKTHGFFILAQLRASRQSLLPILPYCLSSFMGVV